MTFLQAAVCALSCCLLRNSFRFFFFVADDYAIGSILNNFKLDWNVDFKRRPCANVVTLTYAPGELWIKIFSLKIAREARHKENFYGISIADTNVP